MLVNKNTEDAISIACILLSKKARVGYIKNCLVNDGFSPIRADTIIRWAQQKNLVARKPVEIIVEVETNGQT